MQLNHRIVLSGVSLGAVLAPGVAPAQTIDVSIAIPHLTVAEYHRPYVAIWIEAPGAPAKTLSIWYDFDMKANEGTKWLRDVRQWWRVSGRSLKFPADGITGATRAPGTHKVSFGRPALGTLAPGNYTLVVEAAREVGGRELLRLPFAWPPKPGQAARATGTTELGVVSAAFKR